MTFGVARGSPPTPPSSTGIRPGGPRDRIGSLQIPR